MKRLLTLVVVAILSFSTFQSNAQLADNSIAPNWTLRDITGTTHTLYSYLDSGYVVFIDFSAAWCGPCWGYHSEKHLDHLYETHGPAGDNKVRVFFIEGEGTNTLAQIYGASSGSARSTFSQGDWVAGTSYPIIDTAIMNGPYNIGYFPTIYKICPNRLIEEVGQLDSNALYTKALSCPALPTLANDWGMLSYTGQTNSCDSFSMSVQIQNNSTGPLTSCNVSAKIGATTIGTGTWSGTANKFDVITVNVGTSFLSTSATVDFDVTSTDGNAANNNLRANLTKSNLVRYPKVFVQLVTDKYATETAWALINGSGDFLYIWPDSAGVTPVDGRQDTFFNSVDVTKDDCIQFVIIDQAGDGIYDPSGTYGRGFYRVYDNSGDTIVSNYSFTAGDQTSYFKTRNYNVSVNEVNADAAQLNVFPNPAITQSVLSFNVEKPASVSIRMTDLTGKVVYTTDLGQVQGSVIETLDVTKLNAGLYFVQVQVGDSFMSKKINVIK